jgi:hypothetical protein
MHTSVKEYRQALDPQSDMFKGRETVDRSNRLSTVSRTYTGYGDGHSTVSRTQWEDCGRQSEMRALPQPGGTPRQRNLFVLRRRHQGRVVIFLDDRRADSKATTPPVDTDPKGRCARGPV